MKNKQITLLLITLIIMAVIIFVVAVPNEIKKSNKNQNTISGNSLTLEEMVQNAEYTYDVSGSYKNLENDKEYSLENIVLPYFLFETKDSKEVNKDIEKLYKTLAKEFAESLNGEKNKFVETWYDVIRAKGILSVKITVERTEGEEINYTYYTYVFDLDDLELLEYKHLINKLDIPNSEIEAKIENGIKNLKEFKNLVQEDCPEGKTPTDYIEQTLKNYKKVENSKDLLYFVDAVGRINIIIPIELPNATGDMQREIKMK